ncbi:unnamed protein product, partial [Mesorhabditis belari]|uniref:Cytochrome P450 n=1 Tax=Mesorhabditis belari TaxID=2138241 RepID=A0AAF3FUC7_9BILA
MIGLIIILTIILYFVLKNYDSLKRIWIQRRRAIKYLELIPGPPTIPLFGSAHLFKWDNEEFTYQLDGWARKYISLHVPRTGMMKIWLGPIPLVFLATCEALKPVLESNTLITKPPQYNTLKKWIGEGLLISKGKKWYTRRKMITPTFHFNILQAFHEVFCKHADILAEKLEEYTRNGAEVDIFGDIKCCTLDVISETAMGTEINAQKGENTEYVNAVVRISQLSWDHERFPWLWPDPIWYGTGMGFEFDRHVKMANEFTRMVIKQRREILQGNGLLEKMKNLTPEEIKKHRFSFLDLLLGMQTSQNLSDEDIREEVDTFMFEGHDTTSSAVGFALWWLGQELDCQRKIHDELDTVFGDSDRQITSDDLKSLPFLERCLKEALRLTPPVPIFGRILEHDVIIGNYTLPEGLTVVFSPMASGRDPQQWKHPDLFYPDHFLTEEVAKRDAYAFIPFSAGPRNCIGQKFALTEEKILLATVLRKFRFITCEPFPKNRFVPEIILKPSNGFRFKIEKRSPLV